MTLIVETTKAILGIILITIAFRGFVEIFYWWRENKGNNSHIVIALKALIAICTIGAFIGLTFWPIIILGTVVEIASIVIKQKEKENAK